MTNFTHILIDATCMIPYRAGVCRKGSMPEQAMVLITLGFAGMIVILGLWGFVAPRSIGEFIRSWSTIGGMWLAVALRLVFATVLGFAAPLA